MPSPPPGQRPHRVPKGSRVEVEQDERLVDFTLLFKPFHHTTSKERNAAWGKVVDAMRDSGSRIETARGAWMHFKYLCEAVVDPIHRDYGAIQGTLRDKILTCLALMNATPHQSDNEPSTAPPRDGPGHRGPTPVPDDQNGAHAAGEHENTEPEPPQRHGELNHADMALREKAAEQFDGQFKAMVAQQRHFYDLLFGKSDSSS